METFREIIREYRCLVLALLLTTVTSTGITSCGGGGGSSDGALCQQCGDTDGPCQATACIDPNINEPAPCPTPATTRNLICRRKSDSAQQRCYPANAAGTDVDFNFRCDGSRPGSTPGPVQVTPTPATPVPTATANAALCGNGILDSLEVCDGLLLGGRTCGDFCDTADGTLICFRCQLDVSGCLGGGCLIR
jgi:hypothetical protein